MDEDALLHKQMKALRGGLDITIALELQNDNPSLRANL